MSKIKDQNERGRMKKHQDGQIIIVALVFAVVVLAIISSLVGYASIQARSHRSAVAREQALSIAEAGLEAAIWKLNNVAGYSGEVNSTYSNGTYDIVITNLSGSNKLIRAESYIPNATNPIAQRVVQITATVGTTNVGFNYGIQVGDGGLTMDNNAAVTGNVYSNGNVIGSNGAHIDGDVFAAGATGTIQSLSIQNNTRSHNLDDSAVGGNAGHTVLTDSSIIGNVSADQISNCTVGGTAAYNTRFSCNVTGSTATPNTNVPPDPVAIPLPITDQQILDWEADAAAGGTVGSQSISGTTTTLGPKKILGNLTLSNNAVLTMTGTIWVTGTITFNNNNIIKLDPNYATLSGVIIAGTAGSTTNGTINTQNNTSVLGSGTSGSYLMLLSQKVGTASSAIIVRNNAAGAIFYAGTGKIEVSNNAGAKELTGYQVHLNENAVVTYETGLASSEFSSGPGGGWEISDQTWQLLQ